MIVPVFTPPPAPPSARARELGEQIALFVRDYHAENDDVSDLEIEQALTLARRHLRGPSAPLCMVKMMLALGLVMGGLVLGLFFYTQRSPGGTGSQGPILMMIVIGALVACLGVAAVVTMKARSDR